MDLEVQWLAFFSISNGNEAFLFIWKVLRCIANHWFVTGYFKLSFSLPFRHCHSANYCNLSLDDEKKNQPTNWLNGITEIALCKTYETKPFENEPLLLSAFVGCGYTNLSFIKTQTIEFKTKTNIHKKKQQKHKNKFVKLQKNGKSAVCGIVWVFLLSGHLSGNRICLCFYGYSERRNKRIPRMNTFFMLLNNLIKWFHIFAAEKHFSCYCQVTLFQLIFKYATSSHQFRATTTGWQLLTKSKSDFKH